MGNGATPQYSYHWAKLGYVNIRAYVAHKGCSPFTRSFPVDFTLCLTALGVKKTNLGSLRANDLKEHTCLFWTVGFTTSQGRREERFWGKPWVITVLISVVAQNCVTQRVFLLSQRYFSKTPRRICLLRLSESKNLPPSQANWSPPLFCEVPLFILYTQVIRSISRISARCSKSTAEFLIWSSVLYFIVHHHSFVFLKISSTEILHAENYFPTSFTTETCLNLEEVVLKSHEDLIRASI